MSSPRNLHPQYATQPWLLLVLGVFSALVGIFCGAVFVGLGATLALEGTGRYRLMANLAWVGVVLAVLGAVLILWWAVVYWRGNGQRLGWGRWIGLVQLLVVLLAFGAVGYGDLRAVLYLPLVFGLICNGVLLLSIRSEP